jgi:uncharacterized membrane protein YbhN (UPF0104 family)
MSVLILLFQFFAGVKIKILTAIFGLSLKPREWFGLAQVNSLLNYLPIKGGALAKAFYLKGFFAFPYSTFLAVTGASFVLTVIVFSAVGMGAVAVVFLSGGPFSLPIFLIYGVLMLLPLFLFIGLDRLAGRVTNRHLVRFFEGWRMIKMGGGRLVSLIVIDILMVFIDAARLMLSYAAEGIAIDYRMGFVLSPLSNLAAVASQVPAGLGVRECVVGFLSEGMGIGFAVGIGASTLDRILLLFWIVLLGSVSMALLVFYRGYGRKMS